MTGANSSNLIFTLPDGLHVECTADPRDPLVEVFFKGYDQAFVLESEKEQLSGFRACLALNSTPAYARLAARYGPYRELVLVVTDPAAGTAPIGGANFIGFPLFMPGPDGDRLLLSLHLNYLFVVPGVRGRGYAGRILQACAAAARTALQSALEQFSEQQAAPQWRQAAAAVAQAPLLIFLEQNDPLRMDADDYARDSAHAGLDQVARVAIWTRLGARIVDFPYVQPPLSADQEADDSLVLALIDMQREQPMQALAAPLLRGHLTRFFAISVLKGQDLDGNEAARAQLAALERLYRDGAAVALLDAAPWLRTQNGRTGQPAAQPGVGLREVLRTNQ
jgi:GNAT superfamily N-acetyltransferase